MENTTETTTENAVENKPKSNKFKIILPIIIVAGLVYGITKYIHAQSHEETEDAQVAKNMSPIIPKVAGYITKVYVKDNDFVKKGDTLFVIDNKDYLIKVADAKAGLAVAESSYEVSKSEIGSAQANVSVSGANVLTANGNIETAKIRLGRATADFERYNNLYQNHSITKQQYEQSLATKQEAESQLNILKDQQKSTEFQKNVLVSKTVVSGKQTQVASANISRARAMLDAAKLNLDYTIVTASVDGQVSSIAIQPGQLVQPGQSLFYLVNNAEVWVIANFKETQLSKMKVGQEVGIKIDAFGGEEFVGQLASFSPATGSQFSILPPDNATGNFVKTVQRVPVKITFSAKNDKNKLQLLRSGMNANVDVHVTP
jgi:membrane fusion protein, multidrug efflux system